MTTRRLSRPRGDGGFHRARTRPPPLAEEVFAVYERWWSIGKPGLHNFEITVTAKGMRV
ncbi:hypothetical protein STTU_5100 [Streptomyces sp. Tu6071]|uniref:hypothetical protein n=1 Tax=Streptomyces sp. Tu6071 TaxID=355249 RepID=UPI00020E6188|nr:hypothetical protein [Streptomyces sp. Tu6071]EGJ77889.1 hypothetical protein STTU_5100 [Streptomyces sp. Tu6071]